jgi:hypothetical protein
MTRLHGLTADSVGCCLRARKAAQRRAIGVEGGKVDTARLDMAEPRGAGINRERARRLMPPTAPALGLRIDVTPTF